ncbi:MAG: hypothetical protein A2503_10090 [Burkholderiales bacterium RIFOXYD12_FULL_59_19]|nr:MAG: hypothetical protein A2503_10090 [Burkholderiales bacterium RIFOXYD12_FULL_59_19]
MHTLFSMPGYSKPTGVYQMPCSFVVTSYVTAPELAAIRLQDIDWAINVIEGVRTQWQDASLTTGQALKALTNGTGHLHVDGQVHSRVHADLILLQEAHPPLAKKLRVAMAKLQAVANDFRNHDLCGYPRKTRGSPRKDRTPDAATV